MLLAMLLGFVIMEPITYAVHRWVMHGPGMRLHRSHHVPHEGRLEANDAFPVVFAAIVGMLMAVGFNVAGAEALVWLGIGVTLYGAAYAVVHDGYIHHRLPVIGHRRRRGFETLAQAHTLHHRFGGEPYGMLLPVVPRLIRERAARRAESADRPLIDRR